MLQLPSVTLLCVDCVDVSRAGAAIDRCIELASFGAVKLLTSLPTTRTDAVAIPPITSLEAYSTFMLRSSYRHVETSHALIVQHDGYVTTPNAWSDEFLDYDYIGAPWMDGSVGNGGFSLRSRSLMARVALMVGEIATTHTNEDEVICIDLRARLEADGFRFAPTEVAARFSFELNSKLRPASTSGFHRRKSPSKTAIYIKSYPKDFQWLTYCLRSIHKFASGFSEIVVEIPTGTSLPLTQEKIVHSGEYGNGYLLQQSRKMHADLHTDADFILFMDSDAAFTTPVTPETFKTDDVVHWMYTPRAQLETAVPWFPVMEKFLGRRPEYEFMRRLPQCAPRWLLSEIRTFCQSRHGKTLESYIMSSAMFSEFNVMGFFMHEFHRDRALWLNTDDGMSPTTLIQHWSYGGLTPEIRKNLDGILY